MCLLVKISTLVQDLPCAMVLKSGVAFIVGSYSEFRRSLGMPSCSKSVLEQVGSEPHKVSIQIISATHFFIFKKFYGIAMKSRLD